MIGAIKNLVTILLLLVLNLSALPGGYSDKCAEKVLEEKLYTINHGSAYSIVFVHLGNELPSYLIEATHQARLFNTSADIYVIVDPDVMHHSLDKKFTDDNIQFVSTQSLFITEQHKKFKEVSTLSEGYWKKCTERFFLLHAFIAQYNLHDVFHVEYDTMLYVDLNRMMHIFHRYPEIGAVFNNDDLCIPCFLYFKSDYGLGKLTHFMADNASRGWNDMKIIGEFQKQYGVEAIEHLPLIMPVYLRDNQLQSIDFGIANTAENFVHNFQTFQSIFDGNALGQYLGGVNRLDGQSIPGYISHDTIFDPSKLTITWEKDQEARKVPYASYGGTKCRINNLHIHSKKLALFRS